MKLGTTSWPYGLLALAAGFVGGSAQAAKDTPRCAVCPELVTIPPGTAIFGSAEGAPFHQPDEGPRRTVQIANSFAVSRTEVTRGQYAAFVRATNHPVGGDCLTDRRERGKWNYDASTTFRDPGFAQEDDHPVACVSYDDAQAYVAWLNTQEGGGYRLLTEIEWEYVAGAGAATAYPWGDDAAQACTFANGFDQTISRVYSRTDTSGYKVYDPLPCSDGWLNTNPVAALTPNKFGVHGMIGNVSEWVEDCNRPSHDDPNAVGAATAAAGWGTLAHNLRTAERFPYAPTHRDDSIGIRVAKTLGEK
jgi:formylglycine-generating enzyme